MEDDTYYTLLEIDESATLAEIKSAYRRLAKEYHPDTIPEEFRRRKIARDAEATFRLVQEAYEVLSDPVKRSQYDESLRRLHRSVYGQDAQTRAAGSSRPQSPPPQPPPSPPGQSSAASPDPPPTKPATSSSKSSVQNLFWIAAILVLGGVAIMNLSQEAGTPASRGVGTPVRTARLLLAPPFIDEFDGSSLGLAFGVNYARTPNALGAVFNRQKESRIQYPGAIPSAGTMEWLIKVDSGYYYTDFKLSESRSALVFTTDISGGDVTWPGSTWLWVQTDGEIALIMATKKYQSPPALQLRALKTSFRFGEWHAIGVSYGSRGQAIMVDGSLEAENRTFTQLLGAGGTHGEASDVPTIGESVSSHWANNRHEGGFDGVVDRFRVSSQQFDWLLAKSQPAR